MKRKEIYEIVKELVSESGEPVANRDVAARIGRSRQAVHRHLRALTRDGLLEAQGRGRGVRYVPTAGARTFHYDLGGLDEDAVWREVSREVPDIAELRVPVREALQYALTELVNNAIDHSSGRRVRLGVDLSGAVVSLDVSDDGVGALRHIRESLGLADELEAIQQLSKGKVTTDPERHTGEGIFFCSKIADLLEVASGRLRWIVDGRLQDMAVAEGPEIRGTKVRFEIAPRSERSLEQVFEEYTEDHEFTRTRTVVKLFEIGVRFVSRSEAKRLLRGLEQFREVVLDFRGVEMVGQGFADEVFRVWARHHPDVVLEPVNMCSPVAFMVNRALPRPPAGD